MKIQALGSWGLLFAAVLFLANSFPPAGRAAPPPAEPLPLNDGDRVVLLGDAFTERLQAYGYLESLLVAAHPDRSVSFRNLGWSGDTVTGIARAVFGSPADGFARLEKDVREARPTVILVAYGANEAFGGPEKLDEFRGNLNRLLDTLASTGARLVLVSPHRRLKPQPPLPDPADYNRDLALYRDVLREVAAERQLGYVDLYDLFDTPQGQPLRKELGGLTSNGLHLNQVGYWYAAPFIARRLGATLPSWQVQLHATDGKQDATGTAVSAFTPTEQGLRFETRDSMLDYVHSPSRHASQPHPLASAGRLIVRDLPAGTYDLLIDGQVVTRAAADQWQAGVTLPHRGQRSRFEAFREATIRKNEWYFHRYRPQNETYLFLFRKHEQGNNAVEIPQFDPLVENAEQEIHKLASPPKQTFELRRVVD